VIQNLEHHYLTTEQRMREVRNGLLADSDWTQVADAPVDREAWATYRQALRDFPATWTEGPEADFPDTP
jgi:predicted nucleic-acid-binding protein